MMPSSTARRVVLRSNLHVTRRSISPLIGGAAASHAKWVVPRVYASTANQPHLNASSLSQRSEAMAMATKHAAMLIRVTRRRCRRLLTAIAQRQMEQQVASFSTTANCKI
jgi:hypothetical protein